MWTIGLQIEWAQRQEEIGCRGRWKGAFTEEGGKAEEVINARGERLGKETVVIMWTGQMEQE